jgi:hypothetical protein
MLAEICYDPNTGRGDPVKLQAAVKLTFYQIRAILYADRDRQGKLILSPRADAGPTPEETFTQTWLRRGLPRWRIERKWRAQVEAAAAQQQGMTNGRFV